MLKEKARGRKKESDRDEEQKATGGETGRKAGEEALIEERQVAGEEEKRRILAKTKFEI